MQSTNHKIQKRLTAAAKTLKTFSDIEMLTDEGLQELSNRQLFDLQQQILAVLTQRSENKD